MISAVIPKFQLEQYLNHHLAGKMTGYLTQHIHIQLFRCFPSNACRAQLVARRDAWQPYVQPTCTFPPWRGMAHYGIVS